VKNCPKCNKTCDDSWDVCLHCRTKLDCLPGFKEQPKIAKPLLKKVNNQIFVLFLLFAFLTGITVLILDVVLDLIGFHKLGIGNIPVIIPILIFEFHYVGRIKKEYSLKYYHHIASLIAFLLPVVIIVAITALPNYIKAMNMR